MTQRICGTPEERFWPKVNKTDGCWLWTACLSNGYGRFDKGLAHRFAYELIVGPVPDGLELDHMCHNADSACKGGTTCPHRACVNPTHLEPATRSANISRSPVCGSKTHCVNDHEFSEANTRVNVRGDRVCRACDRARQKIYAERKRNLPPAGQDPNAPENSPTAVAAYRALCSA